MMHSMICIEESTYQIRSNYCVRRFKLKNHYTNFEVLIKNNGASIVSCKINNGKDELIRTDNDENNQINQHSNKNHLSVTGFDWQSHVLGQDSISFATSHHKNNSSITYQLTIDNDKIDCLLMLGKLRSVNHLNYILPFFFNLVSIDCTNRPFCSKVYLSFIIYLSKILEYIEFINRRTFSAHKRHQIR